MALRRTGMNSAIQLKDGTFVYRGRGSPSGFRTRTRVRTRMRKVQRRAEDGTFRSLRHAAAAVRLTARRSIRRRPGASMPGRPPHEHTAGFKRSILYHVDRRQGRAVIGMLRKGASTGPSVPGVLEHGSPNVKLRAKRYSATDFLIYGYGPIAVDEGRGPLTQTEHGKVRVQRGRMRTLTQAARAARLQDLWGIGGRPPAPMAARPFMRPALEKLRPRLPGFWQDSVR